MSTDSIVRKVSRGAELLDQHYPGWHHMINLDTHNQVSPFHCVLAQAVGDGSYNDGHDRLNEKVGRSVSTVEFGFDGANGSTELWRHEIISRRQHDRREKWRDSETVPLSTNADSLPETTLQLNGTLTRNGDKVKFNGGLTIGDQNFVIPGMDLDYLYAFAEANGA